MGNEIPYIDAHTHKIKAGSQIHVVNILVKKDFTEYQDFIALNSQNPKILFSAGIHPWYMGDWKKQIDRLKEIATNPLIIAIGECGLDKNSKSPLDEQIELFYSQIALSEALRKPLIIHCVKAYNEILEIRQHSKSAIPWIIHGFNSSAEMARQCLDLGITLSFGQSLLDSKSHSAQIIKPLSNSSFLLETDESNHSIEEIYLQCANIKNISIEQLMSELVKNFYLIFKY